jgi:hypothetical protein
VLPLSSSAAREYVTAKEYVDCMSKKQNNREESMLSSGMFKKHRMSKHSTSEHRAVDLLHSSVIDNLFTSVV